MNYTHSTSVHHARRRGLSMVEAMISLSICSMLLVAAGAAFTASAAAVQINTEFTSATQTARVTMNQMLIELRRADSVQCAAGGASYFDVIRPTETLTTNEIYRRYSFDSTNKRITLQIFYSGGTSSTLYTLASHVETASFGPPQMGTDSNNTSAVQRLPVILAVKIGDNYIQLNGSAGPRRALKS